MASTSQTRPRTKSSPSSMLSIFAWAIILPFTTWTLFSLSTGSPLFGSQVVPTSISEKILQPLGIKVFSSTTASFLDTVKARRTWYALNKSLPISEDKITSIVQDAIQAVPSSFNAQSNRAVVVFGAEHDKLWDIVAEVIKARASDPDQWVATSEKIAGFKAAAGTILFFIDSTVVETFATNIPAYAENFPVWAAQSDAMLQHTLWTALEDEGLGANLQHYNPLIDSRVAKKWSLPASWRLTAQLVFGGRIAGSDRAPVAKKPVEEKLKVFGKTAV